MQKRAIFFFSSLFRGALGAAHQDIRLDSAGQQLLDTVLGGLGLDLAGGLDIGHQGQVDEQGVLAAQIAAQLADGLDKGQPLDIADGAADLDDGDIRGAVQLEHGVLDLVGDVRNDLDGPAQVFSAPLLLDDRVIDAAGGVVVDLGHDRVGIAFIVAHVQVGFRAVIGDVHLAVLEGIHGPGIDVDVGIKLLEGDLHPPAFQQARPGRRQPAPCPGTTERRR